MKTSSVDVFHRFPIAMFDDQICQGLAGSVQSTVQAPEICALPLNEVQAIKGSVYSKVPINI